MKREEDHAWRAGLAYTLEDRRYGTWTDLDPAAAFPPPPLEDHRQRGPALLLEYVRDGFQSFRDIQGMDTPEDYNLAWGGRPGTGQLQPPPGLGTGPGPYGKVRGRQGLGPPRRAT